MTFEFCSSKHVSYEVRFEWKDLWSVIAITSSDCSKFLYCWLWFQPTQMLTKHFPAWFTQTSWFLCILCYCISFRKMVCYVFWTGSEYEIMCNFIVLILTCDWLISKFCLFFFLGGLGSCSHTVNALQIKTIGGGARGGHCLIFSWTGPSLRLKIHYWSSFGRKWKYVKMNRSFKIWGSVLSQLNTAVCHVMSSGFKVLLGRLTT